jgi:Domain of unknown function (DUF4267)
MNGQPPIKLNDPLKIASISGSLTVLVGLGIIFIGVREFLYPSIGASGYGVPLLDLGDGDLLAIKAVRDVVSGIVVLTFLGLGERKCLTYAMAVLALIPLLDGLIVLRHAGWTFTPAILIHWGTAALMLTLVELLRRGK